jgi:hypothetical protein
MLTGDKQETAMCIGNSCRLLHSAQTEIVLNSGSMEGVSEMIDRHIKEQRIDTSVPLGDESARPPYPKMEDWKEGNLRELALVIDTATLRLIFAVPDECVCALPPAAFFPPASPPPPPVLRAAYPPTVAAHLWHRN